MSVCKRLFALVRKFVWTCECMCMWALLCECKHERQRYKKNVKNACKISRVLKK